MKDQKQQLTIDQIKEKYPHQYVGLINIKYKENSNLIESATVEYTENEISHDDLCLLDLQGKVYMFYTTLEDDDSFMNIVEE